MNNARFFDGVWRGRFFLTYTKMKNSRLKKSNEKKTLKNPNKKDEKIPWGISCQTNKRRKFLELGESWRFKVKISTARAGEGKAVRKTIRLENFFSFRQFYFNWLWIFHKNVLKNARNNQNRFLALVTPIKFTPEACGCFQWSKIKIYLHPTEENSFENSSILKSQHFILFTKCLSFWQWAPLSEGDIKMMIRFEWKRRFNEKRKKARKSRKWNHLPLINFTSSAQWNEITCSEKIIKFFSLLSFFIFSTTKIVDCFFYLKQWKKEMKKQ